MRNLIIKEIEDIIREIDIQYMFHQPFDKFDDKQLLKIFMIVYYDKMLMKSNPDEPNVRKPAGPINKDMLDVPEPPTPPNIRRCKLI